ncbi:hypothetical protein K503DRAFT_792437 [Rhizopogon vinicolor AM-OR11-026]|uniref:MIOS-like alpha-solenoid domain-containing protein n=1 Tax=Rhizopogon vinicolor AM-OR11-026 TaxID=1314800 RepID=A0A1B7N128_9AGAM|nr:hypothetical protein K503DRAFT_792437 [Rhizopogon vinicolor AM-OR11-026]
MMMMMMMEKLANDSGWYLLAKLSEIHSTYTYPLAGLFSNDAGNCFILSPSSTLDGDAVSNAAPGRPQPRIARADVVGHRTDGRVLQQHAPTEIVSALAFLPQSTHLFLAVHHGIATSPIDPHQIACCGDGIVTKDTAADVAGTRGGSGGSAGAGAGGVNSNAASFVNHIEFLSSRRGVLTTREKDTSYQAQGREDFADGERFGFGESLQLRGATSKRSRAPWTAAGSGMKPSNVESQGTMALVLSDMRKVPKNFHKPLASFALVPSKRAFSLTSEVMLVNKDRDLELYTMHGTPKQALWSARGDLAVSTGQGCKVLPRFADRGVPLQPWDVHAEEETTTRGRGKTVRQPMFGKGDEDGFLPLDSDASPSKVMKARTYSPASFQHYPLEHSVVRSDLSAPLSGVSDQIALKPPARDEPKAKGRRQLAEQSSSRVRHSTQSVSQVMEDDISMMMRRRATRGYGLASAKHNAQILQEDPRPDSTLSELWAWIHPALSQLSTSAVLDPLTRMSQPSDDFVYGDFAAVVAALCARRTRSERPLKAPRRFALHLCEWGIGEDELNHAIRRWEKKAHLSREAYWLVCTRQYQRAMELLMCSDDEMHNLVSGTLATLIPSVGGTSSNELRDHTERVIVLRDPYFRVMLTQLASKDWSEVLEEELLPLRERLVIAFQFLEDKALLSYLWRTADRACIHGDIEGLIIAGLTPTGIDILQDYVDRTGDVQTAAILGAYASPAKFADGHTERWLETYRDLLDGFKLFHHRVAFDVERGQILQDPVQNGYLASFEWALRQTLIRCIYCSKLMNAVSDGVQRGCNAGCTDTECVLAYCMPALSIIPDGAREAELSHSHNAYQDTIDEAIVICQTYGARSHGMCPVADCDCHCVDEF